MHKCACLAHSTITLSLFSVQMSWIPQQFQGQFHTGNYQSPKSSTPADPQQGSRLVKTTSVKLRSLPAFSTLCSYLWNYFYVTIYSITKSCKEKKNQFGFQQTVARRRTPSVLLTQCSFISWVICQKRDTPLFIAFRIWLSSMFMQETPG